MESATLESIYKKILELQQDVIQIKKSLIVEEPDLRRDFILKIRNIELEKSIMVENFGKRYGLKYG